MIKFCSVGLAVILGLVLVTTVYGMEGEEANAGGPNPPVGQEDPSGLWRGLLGSFLILSVAVLCSESKRTIAIRTIVVALGMQWGLAFLLLRLPIGRLMMRKASEVVVAALECAIEGASIVFGPQLVDPGGPVGFVFAFRVLPMIIFVSALFAVLYEIGLMQRIVGGLAFLMQRFLRTTGPESLNVAASLFLGQTEAPLTIRPYLAGLSRSELMTVMVSGMALVSGSVLAAYFEAGAEPRLLLTAILMNAPASILIAKIMVPERTLGGTEHLQAPLSDLDSTTPTPGESNAIAQLLPIPARVIDAAARGTREGLQLALNVGAVLISFVALITLIDLILNPVGNSIARWTNGTIPLEGLSIELIVGRPLSLVAWLIGVPWNDALTVGELFGSRLVVNELVAYGQLGEVASHLSERSAVIATVGLCGFANLSSVGIQVGGIGALVPSRRADLARLGIKALVAATLANLLSASIAGVLNP